MLTSKCWHRSNSNNPLWKWVYISDFHSVSPPPKRSCRLLALSSACLTLRFEPIAKLRRSDRPSRTNHDVYVHGAGLWAYGFYQPIEIPGIARVHDVRFETLNRKHPAQLAGEIPALGFGQHVPPSVSGRPSALKLVMASPGAVKPCLPIERPRFDSFIGRPRRSQATTGMTHGCRGMEELPMAP